MFEKFVEEMKKRDIEYIHNDYAKKEQEYKEKIERLNKGCEELEKQVDDLYKLETTLTSEIERLNNIINEIEKYMIGKDIYKILLYKLRDLKDSDKE